MSVSDEIIKVLDALSEKFGLMIDWTSENIVPYVEALLGKCVAYELATSIVWLVFAVILGVLCFFLFRALHNNEDFGVNYDYSSPDKFGRFWAYVCVIALTLVPIFIIATQTLDIVTCAVFPEKIIIEELQSIYYGLKGF